MNHRGEDARSAELPASKERHEVVVVGAGPAGLSAAAELAKLGFETVVIEKSDVVGARWRSRYEELRLNSWRVMSNLQGLKMPRSCGRYPVATTLSRTWTGTLRITGYACSSTQRWFALSLTMTCGVWKPPRRTCSPATS